jgi:hypothetical protein
MMDGAGLANAGAAQSSAAIKKADVLFGYINDSHLLLEASRPDHHS